MSSLERTSGVVEELSKIVLDKIDRGDLDVVSDLTNERLLKVFGSLKMFSLSESKVLIEFIKSEGALSPNDLVEAGIPLGSVYTVLKGLVKRGFLVEQAGESGGVKPKLYLVTDFGKSAFTTWMLLSRVIEECGL